MGLVQTVRVLGVGLVLLPLFRFGSDRPRYRWVGSRSGSTKVLVPGWFFKGEEGDRDEMGGALFTDEPEQVEFEGEGRPKPGRGLDFEDIVYTD
ncbi:hypothetical protein Droror1_Dr00023618 [Drosera rotundifolia]